MKQEKQGRVDARDVIIYDGRHKGYSPSTGRFQKGGETKMKREKRLGGLAATWALVVLLASHGWAAPENPALTKPQLQTGSTLKLEGSAPMHGFTSKATGLSLAMEVEGTASSVKELEKLLKAGKASSLLLEIPVKGLKSENKDLDENMYRAMKANDHPAIRFTMVQYAVSKASGSASMVKLSGEMTIAGKTRSLEMEAEMEIVDKELWISGKKELFMKDFGIDPPTMMLGMVSTNNRIVIQFDLILGLKSEENEPSPSGAGREVK